MNDKSSIRGFATPVIIVVVIVVVALIGLVVIGGSGRLDVSKTDQTSSGQPSSETSMSPNMFQGSGISFEYPNDWTESVPAGFIVAVSSPRESTGDTFSENVNIKSIDISTQPDLTLIEISDLWLSQTQDEYAPGDFTMTERNSTTLSGLPAEQFVYNVVDGDINGKGMTVVVLKDTMAFVVSFTAESDSSYAEFNGMVNTILSSMVLE